MWNKGNVLSSDILHWFNCYEREGNWIGHLSESEKMLPYLTAAGHYKYGQQSLPIYLYAPKVHDALMNGGFVGRKEHVHSQCRFT